MTSFETIGAGNTFTVTIATPGVVTKNSHGFVGGERIQLSTDGALPTGLAAATTYYVIYVSANTFRLATSYANYVAGTAINTSGSQSGTHTYVRIYDEKRYPGLPADAFIKQLVTALNTVA